MMSLELFVYAHGEIYDRATVLFVYLILVFCVIQFEWNSSEQTVRDIYEVQNPYGWAYSYIFAMILFINNSFSDRVIERLIYVLVTYRFIGQRLKKRIM